MIVMIRTKSGWKDVDFLLICFVLLLFSLFFTQWTDFTQSVHKIDGSQRPEIQLIHFLANTRLGDKETKQKKQH